MSRAAVVSAAVAALCVGAATAVNPAMWPQRGFDPQVSKTTSIQTNP